jgi:signal transduction histidine kinase
MGAAAAGDGEVELWDQDRLRLLADTDLLDSPPEPAFDDLTRLAMQSLQVSGSLLTLVDDHRQFFKSAIGLREPWASRRGTPLTHSLCQDVVLNDRPVIVEDAPSDPAMRDSFELLELGAVAYLGVPLRSGRNAVLGALCAVEPRPRRWRPEDLTILQELAATAMREIEHRVLERRLRDKSSLFAAVLDSIDDQVIACDRRGHVTLFAAASERMFGGPPVKTIDQMPEAYAIYRADRETRLPVGELPLVRALAGESVRGAEMFVRGAGGGDGRWHSVNACPMRDAGGAIIGAVSVGRDVTPEKVFHDEVVHAARLAAIGTLAGGLAHEINNPLTAVVANLALAERDLDVVGQLDDGRGEDPVAIVRRLRDAVDDARAGAERIRQIIAEVRTFAGAETATRQPVRVRELLDGAASLAGHEIRMRATLHRDYREELVVDANPGRLLKAFLSLVLNAAESIRPGEVDDHQIQLATHDEGDGVIIEVRDTGSGIDADVLPRIFDPFFTTKPTGAGAGLGLTTTHRLIGELGGEIAVASVPGRGTTLRVRLPGRRVPVASGPSRSTATPGRLRLLIIDDEPLLRRSIALLFEGDDVVAAASGHEGLDHLRNDGPFDVVLCDLMMPGMTGMELYDAVRAEMPELADRIVFMTGGAYTDRAREFLARVHNPRIDKPFDPGELEALVREAARPTA